jgi:hypothetical protein
VGLALRPCTTIGSTSGRSNIVCLRSSRSIEAMADGSRVRSLGGRSDCRLSDRRCFEFGSS